FRVIIYSCNFFFSSRRRHTRWPRDWSSDVCSSDLTGGRVWKSPITRKRCCSHETNRWIRPGAGTDWHWRYPLLRAVETDGGDETTRRYTAFERHREGSCTADLSVFDFD